MGPVLSVPRDEEVPVQETLWEDTTPTTSPLKLHEPGAPRKRSASSQHLLFLDVQTSTDDPPQLLTLDAVLYVIYEGMATKGESLSAIIRPRRAYSVMRHMQDVRAHGIPAEILGTQGQAAVEVVTDMFDMIARATGVEYIQDHDKLVIVAHSVDGMMSNLMAAARVDETLYTVWNELEVLCQHTHDTFDEAVATYRNLLNYSVEHLLAYLDRPLPTNRAQAVADLYFAMQDGAIMVDP